jgi:hypothetical protein
LNDRGTFLLTSPIFSGFPDHLFDIPDAFRSDVPYGLSSAPILACLVALACYCLPGFQINPLPQLEQHPALAGLGGSGGNSGHAGGSDGRVITSNIHLVAEVSGGSRGSGTTSIQGPTRGDRVGISGNSYSLGHPVSQCSRQAGMYADLFSMILHAKPSAPPCI